ncbi:hypothetical protein OG264_19115 [Streptomyces xanthophaeus]|uniref:hypothetical protein n=1 Tax=Streptomyces xanthophaeus TaxID=67385 RepID=UPI00386464F9|nr:hypothetical protein OG264_19115 [Streptomyces xanthophaeus]WST61597.1 hypothetical protein OG605_19320 [Streptomyces xanthophaeus]
MSTAPQPSAISQPPVQPEAIRAALAQVAPHLVAAFDRDRAASTARARAEVSAVPLRTFTEAWAVEVAIARHPEVAARLRALEASAGEVTDLSEARGIAAEISRIRNAAAAEAGIRTAGEAAK